MRSKMSVQVLALVSAISVFVAGFVVMNLFWFLGEWDRQLPGLYYFKSATIGDGLVLPLLTYLLVVIAVRDLVKTARVKVLLLSTFMAGAAAGVGIQWDWLVSADTVLNWTIPDTHVFNSAGWYHAVFLCLMVGLLSSLGVGALIAAWRGARRGQVLSWEYLGALTLSSAFPILNHSDFMGMHNAPSEIVEIAVRPVIGGLLVGVIISWRVGVKWVSPYLQVSLLWVAVVFLHSYWGMVSNVAGFTILTFVVLSPALAFSQFGRVNTSSVVASAVASAALVVLALVSLEWYIENGYLLLSSLQVVVARCVLTVLSMLVSSFPLILERLRTEVMCNRIRLITWDVWASSFVVLLIGGFGAYTMASIHREYAALIQWAWVAISGICVWLLERYWTELEGIENGLMSDWGNSSSLDRGTAYRLKMVRVRVWSWGGSALIGLIGAFSGASFALMSSAAVINRIESAYAQTLLNLVLFILASLAGVRILRGTWRHVIAGIISLIGIVGLMLAMVRMVLYFNVDGKALVGVVLSVGIAVPSILAAVFLYVSFKYNVFILRGQQFGASQRLFCWASGISAAGLSLLGVTNLATLTLKGLALGVSALLAAVLTPSVILKVAAVRELDRYVVVTGPRQGVVQDAFHAVLISASLGWYAILAVSTLGRGFAALSQVAVLFSLLSVAFKWILNNNVRHAKRVEESLREHPGRANSLGFDVGEFSAIFHHYIRIQNRIASVMLILLIPLLLAEVRIAGVLGTDVD